jgi:hypothetical protein
VDAHRGAVGPRWIGGKGGTTHLADQGLNPAECRS